MRVEQKIFIKAGRDAIDPHNRRVRVLDVFERGSPQDTAGVQRVAKVQLGGAYAATVEYPLSSLRPADDEDR